MRIMSEQNNDNIEKFFRDHAQNHNIEFREADWKNLRLASTMNYLWLTAFGLFSRNF